MVKEAVLWLNTCCIDKETLARLHKQTIAGLIKVPQLRREQGFGSSIRRLPVPNYNQIGITSGTTAIMIDRNHRC